MEDDSILQVIITIAAVIAVVLSFYNLYVYYRDKKPRIRVKYSSSILGTSRSWSPESLIIHHHGYEYRVTTGKLVILWYSSTG